MCTYCYMIIHIDSVLCWHDVHNECCITLTWCHVLCVTEDQQFPGPEGWDRSAADHRASLHVLPGLRRAQPGPVCARREAQTATHHLRDWREQGTKQEVSNNLIHVVSLYQNQDIGNMNNEDCSKATSSLYFGILVDLQDLTLFLLLCFNVMFWTPLKCDI